MRKSIKKSVGVRVIAALAAVLLFSVMMTVNILRVESTEKRSVQANSLLDRVQSAETAHYKWASNLSNALYAGTEFTGSIDPTTCVLGQWVYGEADTNDPVILALREEIEPLHKELHESASYVLGLNSTSRAQIYYQEVIQENLTTLVGKLDDVVSRGTEISEDCQTSMKNTIVLMHTTSIIGLVLSLFCLIGLIIYVMRQVVAPILLITEASKPIREGHLQMDLAYSSENELGILAKTLKNSMAQTESYVEDINRIMAELSQGNFDVHTAETYIGDFRSIQESISSFTSNISAAFNMINQDRKSVV